MVRELELLRPGLPCAQEPGSPLRGWLPLREAPIPPRKSESRFWKRGPAFSLLSLPASGACLNSERDGSEFGNRNSWFSGQNLALWFRGPEFFEGGNAVPGGKISAGCRNWGSRRWNTCSEKRDSCPGNWSSPRRPNRAFQTLTARALPALEPTKNSGLEFRHPGRKRRSGNWNSRSRNRRSPPRRARRAGCLRNFLAHRFAGGESSLGNSLVPRETGFGAFAEFHRFFETFWERRGPESSGGESSDSENGISSRKLGFAVQKTVVPACAR